MSGRGIKLPLSLDIILCGWLHQRLTDWVLDDLKEEADQENLIAVWSRMLE